MKHLACQALLLAILHLPFAILVIDFRDRALVGLIRDSNSRPGQIALELIFDPAGEGEVDSLFQRAMDAHPFIYSAVLFTVFDQEFRLRAFADEAEGQRNGLCMLLKSQRMLPRSLCQTGQGRGRSQADMRFPELKAAWLDFRHNRDDFLPAGVTIPEALAPEQMLPVPLLLRAFFHTMMDANWQVQHQDLMNGFLNHYAAHYPEGNVHDWNNAFRYDSHIGLARKGYLRALFWMLVGQPFQEVVEQNAHLYRPAIEPVWLIPGEYDPQNHARVPDAPARGGGRGQGGNVPAVQGPLIDDEDEVAPLPPPPNEGAADEVILPLPPLQPPQAHPFPAPPYPPPALILPWGPVEPLQLPMRPEVQLLDNPDGTLRVVAAPAPAQLPPPPVRAAPPASGRCQAGPSGTVSTGAGSSTSQPTCSVAARPVAAPVVAAAPVAVEAPPEPPAAPPAPPAAPPAPPAPPAAVPVAPPANAPAAPEAPVPVEGDNRRAAGAGFHTLNSEDINAIFALTKMRQRKLEQEARKQEDGSPPAKKHKPDEPPKGGGGSTGVAN